MVYIALRYDYDVLSNVILVVILLDHLFAYSFHVGDVSQNGEANLLIIEYSSMGNLDGSLERLTFPCLEKFPVDGTPFILNVLPPIHRIGKHISNNFDSSLNILAKHSHHIRCVLTRCVSIQISSNILNL
jgi:hypothetical protein